MIATAIDTTTSGRIFDSFKEEEYTILFEDLPFNHTGSEDLLKNEYRMNGLDGLRKKLSNVQQSYEDKKNLMTERKDSLIETIANIDESIIQTTENIHKSERSLHAKQWKIQELQINSLQLKRKIVKNRTIILDYLANIHSEGSLIYSADNTIDIFQWLILSSENTDSILSDITYKSLVSQLGQKFVDEYKSLIKDYYTITLTTREEIVELNNLQDVLERDTSNLQIQKKEREKLLVITEWQENLFQKYIDSQRQAQEEIEHAWQDANAAYNASLDTILEKNGCNVVKKNTHDVEKCSRMLAYYRNERALKKMEVLTGTTNVMQWPTTSNRITTYFRDAYYYTLFGSQHDAIDIATEQGSPVYAAMDGYVYYILPPAPWGYSYLALRHPDGYVSVYGHLSEISVLPYQFVTKWQIIAKSGGTPGTPGAWPMTSGAHLHFEVWHGTESIDPLRVISVAPVNYETLPTRYQEKFLTDTVESFGTGANLSGYEVKFTLKGKTEESRQHYLLDTYATPDFRDWDTWIDIALENHIDPSFLLCVGLSETTLGNTLKTNYNIWNVGNTDDGSTSTFESPREWLDWMALTFNNQFLSKYTKVSELSRWGNAKWTIYASSNANWHNNTIRCLSALKGRFVEDDYRFRIPY